MLGYGESDGATDIDGDSTDVSSVQSDQAESRESGKSAQRLPEDPIEAAKLVMRRPELELSQGNDADSPTDTSANFQVRPDNSILCSSTGAVYDVVPWLKLHASLESL